MPLFHNELTSVQPSLRLDSS